MEGQKKLLAINAELYVQLVRILQAKVRKFTVKLLILLLIAYHPLLTRSLGNGVSLKLFYVMKTVLKNQNLEARIKVVKNYRDLLYEIHQ